MEPAVSFAAVPVGFVRSSLKQRANAPRQAWEGAPDVQLEIEASFLDAIEGLAPGDEIWVLTWLHQGRRDALKVRPRGLPENALTGVFATRSPDRPNPIGLHRTTVTKVDGLRIEVRTMEAIDGTPILDIKPVLEPETVPAPKPSCGAR